MTPHAFVRLAAEIPEMDPYELADCILPCGHPWNVLITKEGEFVYHWVAIE